MMGRVIDGQLVITTYASDRTFASSLSTSTEWTTCLIVEAYHLPPRAVATPSSFSAAAMALSDLPAACSPAIRNRTASGRSGA
jgi:hypothetical protein